MPPSELSTSRCTKAIASSGPPTQPAKLALNSSTSFSMGVVSGSDFSVSVATPTTLPVTRLM